MSLKYKVCLDPGHGGTDRWNIGPTGYIEADGVLSISQEIAELAKMTGIDIKLTRDSDITMSLQERANKAKDCDLLVSVHTDSYTDPTAHGFTVFVSAFDEDSRRLGEYIEKQMQNTGLHSRGVRTKTHNFDDKTDDYYGIIRRSTVPAVLVECGFHSNPNEEKLLKTLEFRQLVALCILNGVVNYMAEVVKIMLDGKEVLTGKLVNNTTYISGSLREIATALGLLVVGWDNKNKVAKITDPKTETAELKELLTRFHEELSVVLEKL